MTAVLSVAAVQPRVSDVVVALVMVRLLGAVGAWVSVGQAVVVAVVVVWADRLPAAS